MRKTAITYFGLAVIALTLIIGFGLSTFPPNCVEHFTETTTFSSNGTVVTTTTVFMTMCLPVAEPYLYVYPLQFFIVLIVGIIATIYGMTRR